MDEQVPSFLWRDKDEPHTYRYGRDTAGLAALSLGACLPMDQEPVVKFGTKVLLPPAPPKPLTKRQKRRLRGKSKGRRQ